MAGVQPRRRTLRQRLGKATTRYQQQQAAGQYRRCLRPRSAAGPALEAPPAAVAANAALADALRRAATAHRRLQSAAVAFDPADFERAKDQVRAAEARVQGSLDALRQLGYTIQS